MRAHDTYASSLVGKGLINNEGTVNLETNLSVW